MYGNICISGVLEERENVVISTETCDNISSNYETIAIRNHTNNMSICNFRVSADTELKRLSHNCYDKIIEIYGLT